MKRRQKTDYELQREGMAALTKALGPVGTLRFLRQFGFGSGDYTAERYVIQGNPSLDELKRQLKARKRRPKANRKKA
jgi:hypothetical protein